MTDPLHAHRQQIEAYADREFALLRALMHGQITGREYSDTKRLELAIYHALTS